MVRAEIPRQMLLPPPQPRQLGAVAVPNVPQIPYMLKERDNGDAILQDMFKMPYKNR